ncbi:hypothetical protein E2562_000370 [Oryza meyeriana var. granulata]|uniref:Uncharacterized protein n=1 Tax=Oryza meyeriana var. granulata TaxID=110450 RepID=A0A6G1CBW2_9ORYZ|nr:hypothetical protein E2562_000370 [Oryza meyeriana var. granulata]
MESEEMRRSAVRWKAKAEEAARPGGSSYENLQWRRSSTPRRDRGMYASHGKKWHHYCVPLSAGDGAGEDTKARGGGGGSSCHAQNLQISMVVDVDLQS